MSNDNYETDEWLMKMFEDFYDPCPLDPDPKFDGLEGIWGGWKNKVFINPPYSDPLPWVRKAIEHMNKGQVIVMLLRMDTSTEWFKLLQEAGAKFLWINGRLRHKTGKPANFPSMLVILNKELLSSLDNGGMK